MSIPLNNIRLDFPFFQKEDRIYLDSAATCQTPQPVLDAMQNYYTEMGGNVHRGINSQIEVSSNEYEESRKTVAKFINADPKEIIFTKNSTESLNLVANAWARKILKKGDKVVISILEHHSNIVPWIMLKEEIGIELLWIDCDKNGKLDIDQYKKYLDSGDVKLVSVTGQSNVLGVKTDIRLITELAHKAGSKMMIDASQLIVHSKVDVKNIECDFLAFSGHKLYGPTGIGVLFATEEMQKKMTSWIGGGGMVKDVLRDEFTPAEGPSKFEAGTPPIAEVIGLMAAINWINKLDWKEVVKHEEKLIEHAKKILNKDKRIRALGNNQFSCLSFVIDGVHPHDLSDVLSEKGIAVRAGQQCAKPLHKHFKINSSTRLSIALYNTEKDIDTFEKGLDEALKILLPIAGS